MDFVLDAALSWWLQSAAASVFIGLLYYYVLLPMDWSRDLSDIGYDFPSSPGKSKRVLVREARLKRSVGTVPPIYPNGWFSLLESCTLGKGQVRYVYAMGQNLAVFRGESGQAHVLDAYCPHVGANMAIDGKVSGECLECPFHAWQFSGLDGKCVKIPNCEKVPDAAKVRRWECLEVNGYVFVWHHAEGHPPSWAPQPVPHLSAPTWVYVGRNEFLVSCHAQDIHENAADKAHLSCVHGPGMVVSWLGEHVWSQHWEASSEEGQRHTATMNLKHELKLFGKFGILGMHVRAVQTGPGYVELYVQTAFGLIVILQTVTAVEPLLQRVVHRMYCPMLLLPFAKFVMFGECIMFERDIRVWNHKRFLEKPLLVKEDKPVIRYRRWFSQFYTEHSPILTFQRDTLDW